MNKCWFMHEWHIFVTYVSEPFSVLRPCVWVNVSWIKKKIALLRTCGTFVTTTTLCVVLNKLGFCADSPTIFSLQRSKCMRKCYFEGILPFVFLVFFCFCYAWFWWEIYSSFVLAEANCWFAIYSIRCENHRSRAINCLAGGNEVNLLPSNVLNI